MKIRSTQHTQEARQAVVAPVVDLGAQKASHALPDTFRAQAQAPSLRGLAAFMPVASGATAVPNYDQPTVDLGIKVPTRQIDTPEFKAWFGDFRKDPEGASKVVDEAGEPLVVHHGTNAEFVTFDLNLLGQSTRHPVSNLGFYFVEDQSMAREFAWEGARRVIDVFLKIKNPLIVSGEQFFAIALEMVNRQPANDLKQMALMGGHDGLLVEAVSPEFIAENKCARELAAKTWIVFRPEQIKSTDNCGTFSDTDSNITR